MDAYAPYPDLGIYLTQRLFDSCLGASKGGAHPDEHPFFEAPPVSKRDLRFVPHLMRNQTLFSRSACPHPGFPASAKSNFPPRILANI